MTNLKFAILIPTYNGGHVIKETLQSIFSQSYQNYEIVIQDDASTDNIENIIKSYRNKKIKFFKNKKNLGYPKNIEQGRKRITTDILYLMGQDDILAKDVLLNTCKAFQISESIGAVTRPYFWFDKNVSIPVRATKQLNPFKNEVVRISDSFKRLELVIDSVGQLSGLAFRTKYLKTPFHQDIFPCTAYPFITILKKHPIVFLKGYTVAVRIKTSQTRLLPNIYEKSPLQTWVDFFNTVFPEEKYRLLRKYFIKKYVAANYIGLVQIKNYGNWYFLLREIFLLLKYRLGNLINPKFWFFSLGCVFVPAFILRPLVDWYKNAINSKRLKYIQWLI
jgi:glycosyltransferase involved in cell wall biosynthesis